jgi:hypothetical protein
MNKIWKDNYTQYASEWNDSRLAQEVIDVSNKIQDLIEQKTIFETEQASRQTVKLREKERK